MNTLTVILRNQLALGEMDVTSYLSGDDVLVLSERIERTAFERKHGDIHLKLSNMRNMFSALFASTVATTMWEVVVSIDGTVRWRGNINTTSIDFALDSKWVEFDAFSKTKLFWERMKTTDIYRGEQYFNNYLGLIPLWSFFEVQESVMRLSNGGLIFQGFDLSVLYTNRFIRGPWASSTQGNEGRLKELDPNMKMSGLLEAFQKYYNCEFWIDHATRQLVMRRRNVPTSGTPKNIDALMCDDVEPRVRWLDESKVDYLYAYGKSEIGALRQPFDSGRQYVIGDGGLKRGTFRWVVTGVVNSVETFLSPVLTLDLPEPPIIPPGYRTSWAQSISIMPALYSAITERRVYRWNNNDGGATGWKRIKTYADSIEHLFQDGYRSDWNDLSALPPVESVMNAWIRYDETAARWDDPIVDLDNGQSKPNGKIEEIAPRLGFTQIGDPTSPVEYHPHLTYSFFAKESNFTSETWKEQWIDWFRTKRRASLKVKDMDYVLNQPIIASRLPNDLTPSTNYLVKSFRCLLNRKETELELLSV